eukprot:3071864-Prymnesium_polylepis.1
MTRLATSSGSGRSCRASNRRALPSSAGNKRGSIRPACRSGQRPTCTASPATALAIAAGSAARMGATTSGCVWMSSTAHADESPNTRQAAVSSLKLSLSGQRSSRVKTQKYESFTCGTIIDPAPSATAVSARPCGSPSPASSIRGAIIEAPTVIATVPEPCDLERGREQHREAKAALRGGR